MTSSNKSRALYDSFFRPDLPNLCNVIATVAVFCAVTYVQAWQNVKTVFVPRNPQMRGLPQENKFPIKLFYTSNMPIILLSAFLGTLYLSSQTLFMRYRANTLVRLLGIWEDKAGRSRPVWGAAYLLSPPESLVQVLAEPFHAVFYITFMLVACAVLARTWIEVSGSGPRQVIKQLYDQQLEIKREADWPTLEADAKERKLYPDKKYGAGGFALTQKITTAAALGGMCVAALTITADLLGAIGSGTGILMAVTIIYDMYEKLEKEGGLKAFQASLAAKAEGEKKD
jgi:protein transport protein SEC61 subunit alpha